MSNDKDTEKDGMKPYKPEEPVDEATRKKGEQEVREAAKHAAQEIAAEELGPDDKPMTRKQAEKEIQEAARKVQEEKKKS